MWYSRSKCQKIEALVKASHKQLKIILVSKVRNFGLAFVASKLVRFLLFDDLFPDLAKFQDLDIFSPFNFLNLTYFPDFLIYSTSFLLIPNLSILPLPLFFLKTELLLSFLYKADMLLLFLLEANLSDDLVVFSIKVSKTALLLKL